MKLHIHSLAKEHGHVKEVDVKEIHDIMLLEGYLPSIGHNALDIVGTSESKETSSSMWYVNPIQPEPAIWFKVNIVDSIVIDCNKRCVSWNNLSTTERNQRKTFITIDPLTATVGDYDFEADLDQLIFNTQAIITDYDLLDTQKFNQKILKLLHCHILPIIGLHTEDIPQLEKAKEQQREDVKNIEKELRQKSTNFDDVQRSINTQCEKYVKELTESNKSYPLNFAKILMGDLKQFVYVAQHELNRFQYKVDIIKKKDPTNAPSLEETRQLRDQAHVIYQTRLKARENLQAYLDKTHSSRSEKSSRQSHADKTTDQQLYDVYIGLDQERSRFLNESRLLLDRKLLLLSVLETLRFTVEEIRTQGVSFGVDCDAAGRKPTDVIRHSFIPIDWKPLVEQVYNAVMDKKTELGMEHHQMTQDVIDKCDQACGEPGSQNIAGPCKEVPTAKNNPSNILHGLTLKPTKDLMHTDNKETKSLFSKLVCEGTKSLVLTEGIAGSKDYVFIFDHSANYYKIIGEYLNIEILDHFKSLCSQLQVILGHGELAYKKIWLLYEPHFFKDTMKKLYMLYEKAYIDDCECLKSYMQSLTGKELKIENKHTLQMLQDIDPVEEDAHTLDDTPSSDRKSVNLKPEFKTKFKAALSSLDNIIKQITPMEKLQYLNRCLTEILAVTDSPAGADELTDMVVILLCNCDINVLTSLYVDLKLVHDLAAPFLEYGPLNYSFVTFYGAFSFLLGKMLELQTDQIV